MEMALDQQIKNALSGLGGRASLAQITGAVHKRKSDIIFEINALEDTGEIIRDKSDPVELFWLKAAYEEAHPGNADTPVDRQSAGEHDELLSGLDSLQQAGAIVGEAITTQLNGICAGLRAQILAEREKNKVAPILNADSKLKVLLELAGSNCIAVEYRAFLSEVADDLKRIGGLS